MKSLWAASILAICLVSCSEKVKPEEGELAAAASTQPATPPEKVLPDTLDEAVKTEFRSEANKARDAYRHPKETLEFFGLKPDMKVVEVSPGMGWYTEVLAPFLTKKGQLIAAVPPAGDNPNRKKYNDAYDGWLKSNPEVKVKVVDFVPGKPLEISEPVDMVVTFRNVHNWMNEGKGADAFKTFYSALKPGGILGVEEHRASEKKYDKSGKSGYVRESDVIKFAKAAGFKLEGRSEVNANPKDTKDYAKGVWTLPPTLALGDVDKEKYVEIGESDRMTLKFVKPVKGSKK